MSKQVYNKPIAESKNFIILDRYTRHAYISEPPGGYQSESALERELIADLQNQGYEYLHDLNTPRKDTCHCAGADRSAQRCAI